MKKIVFNVVFWPVILILSLTGCQAKKLELHQPVSINFIDFTKYSEKGFLFTEYINTVDYSPIAIISMEILPKISPIIEKDSKSYNYSTLGGKPFFIIYPSNEEILDSVYNRVTKMGGDCMTDFQITLESRYYNGILLTVTKIYGFAIKRKKS